MENVRLLFLEALCLLWAAAVVRQSLSVVRLQLQHRKRGRRQCSQNCRLLATRQQHRLLQQQLLQQQLLQQQ